MKLQEVFRKIMFEFNVPWEYITDDKSVIPVYDFNEMMAGRIYPRKERLEYIMAKLHINYEDMVKLLTAQERNHRGILKRIKPLIHDSVKEWRMAMLKQQRIEKEKSRLQKQRATIKKKLGKFELKRDIILANDEEIKIKLKELDKKFDSLNLKSDI